MASWSEAEGCRGVCEGQVVDEIDGELFSGGGLADKL